MRLEMFFEKFELFADAPGAVAKMRELTLRLALQGQFAAKGTEAWKVARLGDFLEVQNGFAFESSFFNTVNEGVPLIRIRDIANSETQVYYSGEYRNEFIVHRGDLIIGMDGNFNVQRWRGKDALLNQRVCRLRNISSAIDQTFLFYFIQQHLDEIHKNTTYTTVKHISSKQINEIEFQLPPLAEQKGIVAKVDELMALCDRLEAQQQERQTRHAALACASLTRFAYAPTSANLNFLFHDSYTIEPADLRKAILSLAVQGKLVPHDPSDQPDYAVATDNFRADTGAEAAHDIPETWVWVSLGELGRFINGDRSKNYPSKNLRVATGVPFINAGHLRDGDVSLKGMDYITEAHFNLLGGGKVEKGDVLYCLRGSLGKSAIVSSISRGAIASSLLIIRPSKSIHARFLYAYLTSPLGESMISKYDNGSAQPNLSAANLKKYLVPLPPLDEQRRIVAKVDQLMALVDQLETQLAESQATAEKLMEAVVAELTAPGKRVDNEA